jgi:hypothetical protein
MSRRSSFLVGLLFCVGATYVVVRVLFKATDTHILFIASMILVLLVALSRLLDLRRPR